jgi:hypothetical protein
MYTKGIQTRKERPNSHNVRDIAVVPKCAVVCKLNCDAVVNNGFRFSVDCFEVVQVMKQHTPCSNSYFTR